MHNIDFLPDKYRQQRASRRNRIWLLILVALFGAVISATSLFQYGLHDSITQQLALVDIQYANTQALKRQRDDVVQRRREALAAANLYAYLHHPWPRTQILAAIAEPLPEPVMLAEVRIGREMPRQGVSPGQRGRRRSDPGEEEEEDVSQLLPAERDLKRLRDEIDKAQTIVSIVGITDEASALHRYLADLGDSELFMKAELSSIESLEDEQQPNASRFSARLIMRPGYGQLGGAKATEARGQRSGIRG